MASHEREGEGSGSVDQRAEDDVPVPGASTPAFDAWLERLQLEQEQDDELLMDMRYLDSHQPPSEAASSSAPRSLLARAASLRPEDAPMQLDGEHWTVVDMHSSRFERMRKRSQLTAQELLEHMSCFGVSPVTPRQIKAGASGHEAPASAVVAAETSRELEAPAETIAAVRHVLDTLSTESESEEADVLEMKESVPQANTASHDSAKHSKSSSERARRQVGKKALVDEVTEEDNMSLDGSYWQIDPREARTRRRYKRRAAELPSDEVVLVGSGNYGEKKRRAQEQMKELKLQQTLRLSRQQLFHFGDYIRDLSVVLRGEVPQFLRIYKRAWQKSPSAFLARVRKGAHHFSFVPEHAKKRRLEEKDAVGLRCLLQALQEASNEGGAQGGVTKSVWNYFESQEEIFGDSQDTALDLLSELPPFEADLQDGGYSVELYPSERATVPRRPPKKQQKTNGSRKEPKRDSPGAAASLGPTVSSREDAVKRHQLKGRSFLEMSRLAGAYGTAGPLATKKKRSSSVEKRKRGTTKKRSASRPPPDLLAGSSREQPAAKKVRRSSSAERVAVERPKLGAKAGGRRKQATPMQRMGGGGYRGAALSSIYQLEKPRIARPSTMTDADYARSLKGGVEAPTHRPASIAAKSNGAALAQVIDLAETPFECHDDFDFGGEELAELPAVLHLPHPKPSVPHRFAYPATIAFPEAPLPGAPPPPAASGYPSLPLSTVAIESALRAAIPRLLPPEKEWNSATGGLLDERLAVLEAQIRDVHERAGSAVDWPKIGATLLRTLQLKHPDLHRPLSAIFETAVASLPSNERLAALHKSVTVAVAVHFRARLLSLFAAIGDHCTGLRSRLCHTLLSEHFQLLGKCRWAFTAPALELQSSALRSLGRELVGSWPGGAGELWTHLAEAVKGWRTMEDVFQPSITLLSLTAEVDHDSEFHESQLMMDLGTSASAAPADTEALQGEQEDLTELTWQLIFHICYVGGAGHSNWGLVEHLVASLAGTRLLSSHSIPELFREDVGALLLEDGSPRRWLQSMQDAQVVTQVLRRLVDLTGVWDTAATQADERCLASIVKLFVAHFQVLQYNDKSKRFPAFLSSEESSREGSSVQKAKHDDLPFVLLLKLIHNHLHHLTSPSSTLSPAQQQQRLLRLASSLFVSLVPAVPHVIRDWGALDKRGAGASRSNVRNCMSVLLTFVTFSSGRTVHHILGRIVDIVNFAKSEMRAREIVLEGIYLSLMAKYRLLVPLSNAHEPLQSKRRDLDEQVTVIARAIGQLRAVLLKEHSQLLRDGVAASERRTVEHSLEFELRMLQLIALSRQEAVTSAAQQLAALFSSSQPPPPELLPLSLATLMPLDLLEHILRRQWEGIMPLHLRCKALQTLLTLLRNDSLPPLPVESTGAHAESTRDSVTSLEGSNATSDVVMGTDDDWDFFVSDEELLAVEQRLSSERLRSALGAELASQAVAVGTSALALLTPLMQVLEGRGATSAPQADVSAVIHRKQVEQLVALSCHCVGNLAAVAVSQQTKSALSSWRYYFARFGATARQSPASSFASRPVPLQLFLALLERIQGLQNLAPFDVSSPPEEELLSMWLLGMCARKYSVQHRFTRSLLLLCEECPLLAACFAQPLSPEHCQLLDLAGNQERFFQVRSKLLAIFVRGAAAAASSNTGTAARLRTVVEAAPPYIAAAMKESAAAAALGLELKSHTAHAKLCFRLVATLCEHLPQLLYKAGTSSRALPAIAERFFLSTELDRHLQGSYLRQLLLALSAHHSGGDMYLLRLESRILSHWVSSVPAGDESRFLAPLVSALVSDTLPLAYLAHWLRDVVAPAISNLDTSAQTLRFATTLLHNLTRRPSHRDEALLLLPATVTAFSRAKAAARNGAADMALRTMQFWLSLFVDGRRNDLFGEELLSVAERQNAACTCTRAFAALLAALLAAELLQLARLPTQAAAEQFSRSQKKLELLGVQAGPCPSLVPWASSPPPNVADQLASKAFSCLANLSLAGATGQRAVLGLLPVLHKELSSAHAGQGGSVGAVLLRYQAFLGELGKAGEPYLNSFTLPSRTRALDIFMGL